VFQNALKVPGAKEYLGASRSSTPMESFFSRYRNALVLIVVLVAQLLALAIQAKRPSADGADRPSVSLARFAVITIVTPPERLIHNTGRWIRSVWFGYIDLIHVRRQNADLRRQIERLRLEQAGIAQDAEQGQRLQHMLGFAQNYIYKTQPAQVIGTGGTDQSQVLYIDKGSASGLQQDMPVITADGIVGKLKDVFPHTSQVLLVTDPTSGVGVILQTTRIRGILKGRAYGQLQVADVSPDSRIKAGEQIVTSGGDQIFPRGLPVGTVDRVIADPDRDPLVDVIVHPAAGLSQLEEVLVVTNMTDTVSAQETKDLAESEAEGEAAKKRASDVLSERLPSRSDPNAPADTNPEEVVDANGNAVKKIAPKPAHPDSFSPNAEPDAAQMVAGQRWAPVKDGTEDLAAAPRPASTQTPAAALIAGTTGHHPSAPNAPATASAKTGSTTQSGTQTHTSKAQSEAPNKTHATGEIAPLHKPRAVPHPTPPTPVADSPASDTGSKEPRKIPPPPTAVPSNPPQAPAPEGGAR
jgi:rod shape-determining protein MreC